MKWLTRKPSYTQAELSQQAHDITLLQAQRDSAKLNGSFKGSQAEYELADALVEMAQRYLERMYEANEPRK